jgi:zinc protease
LPKRTANEQLPIASSSPANPAAAKSSAPILLQQPGSAALLQVVYPLPDINHPDVPAIDLMDTVLTGGRSSLLYQALVEKGLASSVGAYAAELAEPGWYSISATAAPGHTPTEMNQVLQQALTQLKQAGINQEELNRAKTQLKTSFVLSNQDISSQASQLAYYQTVAKDYQYVDRYLAAIDRVTGADIQRVAQTYLDPAKQTVGYFEPTQAVDSTGASASSSGRTAENFSPGKPVDPAEVARYLPNINDSTQKSTQPLPEIFTLNNGLKVLLLPDPSTPIVNLAGWVKAGSSFDTAAKAGLANLTAANLLNGTPTQDALTLAKTMENDGASLSFSALREGTSISGNALTENLPTLIQTLADVMQHAAFPADQLELSRQRSLIGLKAELDDPEALSWRVFRQAVYPANHPYSTLPTQESLNRIEQADVIRFYQTYYRPDTTVLALVGNFDSGQVRSLLNQSFSNWKAQGKPPALSLPTVSLPPSLTQLNRAMPGKAEAVTYLGYYSGISRKDPRYYSALVLNQILGGDTLSSRLGTEVRDRQGLTYGIYSFFQAGVNPGPFAIEMQTAPGDVSKAIDSTLALLKQFREDGVTQAELATAKRSIASSYPVNLADPSNVASVILDNEIFGLSPEEIRQFPEHINAVTSEQVKQAIQELIHPGNLVIVTAGPGSSKPVGG